MPNPFAAQPSGGTGAAGTSPFDSTPSQPVNGADQSAGAVGAADLNATQEPPIDINDPMLTSESLTVKEGDAFTTPPPPPDNKWRVKLKHEGIKQDGSSEILPWIGDKQKDGQGNVIAMFAKTVVSFTVQDPNGKYDGYHLQVPFFYMDTKTNREGLSKVMTVLNLLRKADGSPWITVGEKLNHPKLMERFIQALQSEPELIVQSTWEVVCDVCQSLAREANKTSRTKTYPKGVQGMKQFPPSKTVRGEYDPDFWCLVNKAHGTTRARALATQFFALPK